jgi:hypothetical protein
MIKFEDIIEDETNDEIGQKIAQVQSLVSGSKDKREALAELCDMMRNCKYAEFDSDAKNYATIRVGESFIYDVPTNKTGHLMAFRGKRIRVVCVESGKYNKRSYMAGGVES